MTTRASRLLLLATFLGVAALLILLLLTAPRHPVALLRVVDAATNPIAGAVIRPEGLRTKPGPYVSGWYAWQAEQRNVPATPVKTDADGYARVPYPKYVFERIETGTLCLSVEHPDYVPARPEPMVAFAPPSGASWRVWFDYVWGGIRHKVLVVRPDPIVLQKGAVLELALAPGANAPKDTALFAQISAPQTADTNFWLRPRADLLVTKRLQPGRQTLRLVLFDSSGMTWFSPVTNLTAAAGRTNQLVLEVKPGVSIRGRLDESVPRPVRNGRVIVQVWPPGEQAKDSPPEWHTWSNVNEDGTFRISSLPEGQLEIVGLCDGFVSTNGPGQFPSMHYPQKHWLATNDLTLVIGMEPTACLEVQVRDDQGHPLKEAHVSAWPNVRYGEWSATILGDDRYNTADAFRVGPRDKWWEKPGSFRGTTDDSGLVVLSNLPMEVREFNVEHARFALPAKDTGFGQKRRQASVILQPGQTNRVTVRLEPLGQSPITHY